MDKWTREDEAELSKLKQRKAAVEKARRAPLLALVKRVFVYPSTAESLAESLIREAEELRDALEPFDSGARNRASA